MAFVIIFRKLVFLILLFNILILAQNSNQSSKLNELISVDFVNEKFSEVLKQISKKTKVIINFSKDRIPHDQEITLKENNQKVISILKKITQITNTQLIITEDGDIIISKKLTLSIKGRILDERTNFPLIGANIIVKDIYTGTTSDVNGDFILDNLKEGTYTINIKYIGYKEEVLKDILVTSENSSFLEIKMTAESISLSEIVITPGSFAMMQKKPSAMQTLSREDIQNMSFGEDVYRAVTRIPGIISNDFSSKFIIRGGETDEILVNLDGMTLYEPFHLKDIHGGVLSIVDAAIIGEANILAGAFPAEYGDKMSGIFEIQSLNPYETKNRISASISMMNARVMGQGTYDDQNGSWIVSARRGYLDFILDKVKKESTLSPAYYDFYAKSDYWFTKSDRLSFNFLYGGDNFDFDDEYDSTRTNYYNASAWSAYDKIWSKKLNSKTVLYFNKYDHTRKGIGRNDDTAELEFNIKDYRKFNMFGFKHNMHFDHSENLLIKFGIEFSRSTAEYDYLSIFRQSNKHQLDPDYKDWESRIVKLDPAGNKFSAYLSARFKISGNLAAEIGGRYAQTSYTKDNLFSPRINLAWMISPKTTFRAGLGDFYQTQDIQGIRVQHGEAEFNDAELAKHYMMGIEHLFNNGIFFRVEAYYKTLKNLKTAYRNISDHIVMFPEIYHDVMSINLDYANSSGMEFLVKYDQGGLISFWGSYAYALADEQINKTYNLSNDVMFENVNVPRPFDQKNTIGFDLNIRPGKNWHINFAWQFRTGWPTTQEYLGENIDEDGNISFYKYYCGYQQSRLPDYHRLDLKVSKYFTTSAGNFNIFLEIMNVYNRKNIRAYSYSIKENESGVYLKRKQDEWLPFIPSLGIRWDLDF